MANVRLTKSAESDIEDVLLRSRLTFGADAQSRYERLLAAAFDLISLDPRRLRPRAEVRQGLSVFHLALARARARKDGPTVGDPRYLLVCRFVEPDTIEVVRVLHDAMDLARHLPPDD
jgi:toxin ParE1/3/4